MSIATTTENALRYFRECGYSVEAEAGKERDHILFADGFQLTVTPDAEIAGGRSADDEMEFSSVYEVHVHLCAEGSR